MTGIAATIAAMRSRGKRCESVPPRSGWLRACRSRMPSRSAAVASVISMSVGFMIPGSDRCHVSAIDIEALARNVSGGVRAEEHGGADEVVEAAEAPQRDLAEHRLLPGLVLVEHLRQLGAEIAGADAVDADAASRPLGGEGAGHAEEPALRRAVRHRRRHADLRGQRADVEDGAALAPRHDAGGGLGTEEGALEVGVHDAVPEHLLDLQRIA